MTSRSDKAAFQRRRVHILLSDKDVKSRQDVSELLRRCSYQVTAVETARQALGILRAGSPAVDLILAEVELPNGKGFKMLKHIIREEGLKQIPIVMMSSRDEVAVVVKCLRLGAADFLVKPLRTNELLNLWTHMWRRRKVLGERYTLNGLNINDPPKDLLFPDTSESNTNSTDLFSDDTDDKKRTETGSFTGGNEEQLHSSGPKLELTLKPGSSLPTFRFEQEVARHRNGTTGYKQHSPMSKNLVPGQTSAFLYYSEANNCSGGWSHQAKSGRCDEEVVQARRPGILFGQPLESRDMKESEKARNSRPDQDENARDHRLESDDVSAKRKTSVSPPEPAVNTDTHSSKSRLEFSLEPPKEMERSSRQHAHNTPDLYTVNCRSDREKSPMRVRGGFFEPMVLVHSAQETPYKRGASSGEIASPAWDAHFSRSMPTSHDSSDCVKRDQHSVDRHSESFPVGNRERYLREAMELQEMGMGSGMPGPYIDGFSPEDRRGSSQNWGPMHEASRRAYARDMYGQDLSRWENSGEGLPRGNYHPMPMIKMVVPQNMPPELGAMLPPSVPHHLPSPGNAHHRSSGMNPPYLSPGVTISGLGPGPSLHPPTLAQQSIPQPSIPGYSGMLEHPPMALSPSTVQSLPPTVPHRSLGPSSRPHFPYFAPTMSVAVSSPHHHVAHPIAAGAPPPPWPQLQVPMNERKLKLAERREAALSKFRQKRKDRCFEKKIRYVSRKRLAEQRPRNRGQFVRLSSGTGTKEDDDDEEYEEEDEESEDAVVSSPDEGNSA